MDGLIIKRCTVNEVSSAPNFNELQELYAVESSIDGLGQARAQLENYRQMEAAGFLWLIGAFLDGQLIGLLQMVVSNLPHYGRVVATTESFFVAPAARKSGAGLTLLHEAECWAREMGAVGFFVSTPTGGQLERVMDGMRGWRPTNRVFFKTL